MDKTIPIPRAEAILLITDTLAELITFMELNHLEEIDPAELAQMASGMMVVEIKNFFGSEAVNRERQCAFVGGLLEFAQNQTLPAVKPGEARSRSATTCLTLH